MTTRCLTIAALTLLITDNHTPVVKIRTPAANTTVAANTPLRYEISVTDAEDGDSRYDEINPKEVALEIRSASAQSASTQGTPAQGLSSPGLTLMARSN